MSKFNLNDYEQVEDRIKRFYKDNSDGRIITKVLFQDGQRTMIKASIYLNREDQEIKCPKATGIAEEEREGRKKTSTGSTYEPVNFSSWTENCETSAIGRAFANMNISGSKRPSREEMGKVQRYQNRETSDSRPTTDSQNGLKKATTAQLKFLRNLGYEASESDYLKMSFEEADKQIKLLVEK